MIRDIFDSGFGEDLFIFGEGHGSDFVDGGEGYGWIDIIKLTDAFAGTNIGKFGTDWTVELKEGSMIVNANSIDLTNDSDGVVTLNDGSELTFQDIEKIQW